MQIIRVIDPDDPDKPNIENDDVERHYLFTCGIEVTIDEHLALLASPKKCDLLGIDNTNEREIYSYRYEWYGWPEMPPIDPSEENND